MTPNAGQGLRGAAVPRERPLLFSAPMIRALLSGAKTQTRRLVDMRHISFIGGRDHDHDDPALWGFGDIDGCWHVLDRKAQPWSGAGLPHESYAITCPHGSVGERLWVRETWAQVWKTEYPPDDVRDCDVQYRADWPNDRYPGHWPDDCADDPACGRWKPSIHMPRWASRITLEITGVRVERLQQITDADAIAEGMPHPTEWSLDCSSTPPTHHFRRLWDAENGKRCPWSSNPFLWVIDFRRLPPTGTSLGTEDAPRAQEEM